MDKSLLTETVGYLNAALTLVETFPNWVSNPHTKQISDWLANGGQLTSTFDLLQLLFVVIGNDDWEDTIMKEISKRFLTPDGIAEVEAVIKDAILVALQGYISCSANPIIPDSLIDGGHGGPKRVAGEGYVFPLSNIDLLGKLYTSPATTTGKYYYFDIIEENESTERAKVNMANLWKSRDFDAFLFYVINKAGHTGDDLNKCTWDNRYSPSLKTNNNDWKTLYGNTDAFYDALTPSEIEEYNKTAEKSNLNLRKKKQIARFEYLEGNSYGDGAIKVLINDTSYYRKIYPLNQAMLVWDHDYLQSVRLLDVKTILAQYVDLLFNSATKVSITLNRSKAIADQLISQVIQNVIAIDDTQINDCYFSFSNDDYNNLLERSDLIRRGMSNDSTGVDAISALEALDTISTGATLNNDVTTLSNFVKTYSQNGSYTQGQKAGISVSVSCLLADILKKVSYPFIECLFTPKLMLLFAVNMEYIGKDMSSNWNDVLSTIMNIAKNIIIQIKNMIIQILYKYVQQQLTILMEQVLALRIQEQIKDYRDILTRLFKLYQLLSKGINDIGSVNYAEIDSMEQEANTNPVNNTC